MRLNSVIFIAVFLLTLFTARSQSPSVIRSDRLQHTGFQRYDRNEWGVMLLEISEHQGFTPLDSADVRHILADQAEFTRDTSHKWVRNILAESNVKKPWLGVFYPTTSSFLYIQRPDFNMVVNPVIHAAYYSGIQENRILFQNTRGVDIRAYIDKKLYIYTRILENQRSFPLFADQRIQDYQAIPGQGSWQPYQSSVIENLRGYDYFTATAYAGFAASKNIHLEFGHGNHFIGHGLRSLLLSDHAHNYLYLRLDTRMWRFRYQNIFAELSATSAAANPLERILPKKYMAAHYLSYAPSSRWEIGFFESVIFARENGFELQYLNPVILYRAVEQWIDSPDNVLLGLNARYHPVRGVQLYSQLIVDEFRLSEVRKNSGWWANKVGWQAGAKYYNAFGIDHLDLQAEFNAVRPYTYTHWDTLAAVPSFAKASYSHYNQPLAHPLGANFREGLLQIKYMPHFSWNINARFLYTIYGKDAQGQNWGGNILLHNGSKMQLYSNRIGQGIPASVSSFFLEVSHEIAHNVFIDFNALVRRQTTGELAEWQNFIGGGVRVNAFAQHYDY